MCCDILRRETPRAPGPLPYSGMFVEVAMRSSLTRCVAPESSECFCCYIHHVECTVPEYRQDEIMRLYETILREYRTLHAHAYHGIGRVGTFLSAPISLLILC